MNIKLETKTNKNYLEKNINRFKNLVILLLRPPCEETIN